MSLLWLGWVELRRSRLKDLGGIMKFMMTKDIADKGSHDIEDIDDTDDKGSRGELWNIPVRIKLEF